MKIWENFKSLSDARPSLQRRNCWSCCDRCKKKWSAIETTNVHMTVRMVQGQSVTRFVCDTCLPDVKKENNVE